jgi:hypothetical protein
MPSYHVLVIKADGSIEKTVQPKAPTYKQQFEAVGGFIETVPNFTRLEHDGIEYKKGVAYADEEGQIKGKQFNMVATMYWQEACPKGDLERMTLYGDVIFIAKEVHIPEYTESGSRVVHKK